jgi:hypothetical protein
MYYNTVRRAITFKQYYSLIVWPRFVWRNVEYMLMYWAEHLSEILKLFLENGIRLCIIDALICRMNIQTWMYEHWAVALFTVHTSRRLLPHSNTMTSRKGSPAENTPCNVEPFVHHQSIISCILYTF